MWWEERWEVPSEDPARPGVGRAMCDGYSQGVCGGSLLTSDQRSFSSETLLRKKEKEKKKYYKNQTKPNLMSKIL